MQSQPLKLLVIGLLRRCGSTTMTLTSSGVNASGGVKLGNTSLWIKRHADPA
jgi:hypothetical protein